MVYYIIWLGITYFLLQNGHSSLPSNMKVLRGPSEHVRSGQLTSCPLGQLDDLMSGHSGEDELSGLSGFSGHEERDGSLMDMGSVGTRGHLLGPTDIVEELGSSIGSRVIQKSW